MIYKTVMLVGFIVLGIGLFGNVFYKAIKSAKYKNDERWQLIQNKANQVIIWYQGLITIVFGIILVVDILNPFQISLSVSNAVLYAFILLFLQYTIELIFLMYFDKSL
ncbi:hypothetical protein [Paenibacillus sp. IHBB 10380]|uniref:hypothetical protein n=1 Tax=Paenibacillus sp. IHBB 10380 TaxID=1566358 RepID=UPI0005CFDEB8|nr:hypothetical protein [Paenibacillus sp. IHBB 10380]AJS60518.1 hypothetical protein UB51_21000 [Paenibacillus sp. IHBB 10380]